MTYVLVFMISNISWPVSRSGVTTIDNYTTQKKCEAAGEALKKKFGTRLDWYDCFGTEK